MPVTSGPGVVIGMPEFDGRNLSGYFSAGRGSPAGMGSTISGVTITMSSVLFLVTEIDWKNLPRIGTSPMNGIFGKFLVSRLSSSPPMAKLCPSPSSTSVFTLRMSIDQEQ